ncbi:unnamed protein product [Rhizoctonia solani]|uniref:Uncharacterized protein n=1 Tax=Rhizoctonia solani TaxID=456999 RepID=A0A8H3E5K9_9AGAM|nr:unnamed protein product [Rhizoctonia solani]
MESRAPPHRKPDSRIQEGNYHINQVQCDVTLSMTAISNGSNSTFAMKSEVLTGNEQPLQSQFWTITYQPGIENSFTIDVSLNPTDAGAWATIVNADGTLEYQRTKYFATWSIDYVDTYTVTDADSVTRKVYSNCSIYEPGTTRYWTVGDDGSLTHDLAQIKLVDNNDQGHLLKQSFELKQLSPWFGNGWEQNHTICSVEPISVTATDDTPIRKFYFGTNKISPNDPILSCIGAQLSTDACATGKDGQLAKADSTWFEVAVFSKLPTPGQQVTLEQVKSRDGKPLMWESHRLPCHDVNYHALGGGMLNTDGQYFCKSIEEGDYIGVLVCAQYGSTCAVRGAKLRFEIDKKMGSR